MALRGLVITVIGLLLLSNGVRAQEDQLIVSVLDDSNHGVASTIYVRSPDNKDERLRQTSDDGHLQIPYKCHVGYTLWAQPTDDVRYFKSGVTDCASKVTLLVSTKQSPIGPTDDVVIKIFGSNESANTYTLVSRLAISTGEKTSAPITDPSLPPSNSPGCIVELNTRALTQIFERTNDGQFKKLYEFLSAPGGKDSIGEINTFNWPCYEASADINKNRVKLLEAAKRKYNMIYNEIPDAAWNSNVDALIQKYLNPS
jgi:hypothetical protein